MKMTIHRFDQEMLLSKRAQSLKLLQDVKSHWLKVLGSLDLPTSSLGQDYANLAVENVFRAVQEHQVRISWKREIKKPLQLIFAGREYQRILERCDEIHQQVLKGRVFVALHMHAGDGNVHTNIPVNSDDYEMMHAAHTAVARIMKLAGNLEGVISGEHGIGITKMAF